jgi:glucose/arabinose dehydrogenase
MKVRGSSIRLISIIVMVILVFSVFTLALQIREGLSAPIVVMQDLTESSGQSVHSGRQIHAEYVSPSSILIGQQIDTIDLVLKKIGSPVGLAEIGVFNTDLSVKRLFATKDVATLATDYTDYSFSIPTSQQPYTIQSGDRIGVKYAGDASSGNYISIMRDTNAADPFDGTSTYHTTYTGSWNSFTSVDLTMTLKLVNGPSGGASPSVSVSHSPANPTSSQTVTFTASATDDDVDLSSIQIFANGALIESCTVSGTSANCSKTGGPYAEGSSNSYYATATNILGQIGTSSTGTFSISPSSGTGTFVDTEFEGGLDDPTSMAFAPDGRLFVAEKAGDLRVIKNGVLQSAPFLTVPVDTGGERGLIGIAFDPNFQTNKFVYIQYTTNTSPIHNKVSRYTASTTNPDVAAAGSGITIMDLDNLDGDYHNAGAIHFGPDGKLYVAAGENGHASDAQDLDNRLGKILRINANGTIPSDNPFFNTSGAKKEIWAYGLRNPFTFAFRPGTSTMNINDVGQDAWEEINRGAAGANFGWPTCEGTCSNPSFTNPIYTYQHPPSDGRSVAGGAFYEASQFPVEYRGNYFFGDYVANYIKRVTPTNQVIDFLTDAETPVDIDVGPDGSLYYLSYQDGSVHKVQFVTTGGNAFPTAVASANPTSGVSPLTVNFGGSGSSDPDGDPLTYSWNFGDNTPNGSGVSVAHTYNSTGSYSATLTVDDGRGGTDTDVVSINVGTPPVGTIINPPAGTKYDAGDTFAFSGSANDDDETLTASAFNWKILLHHNTHTHPFQEFNAVTSGSFTLPQLSETSDDVWYRIYLTVTDSTGLQHQTTRDLNPNKVTMTLASNIPGLTVNLDGVPTVTPSSVVGVVGISRTLQAPLSQSLGGQTYQFDSWSDGGAATHNIFTPDVDTTFTANYVLGTAEPVIHMQDTTTGGTGWGIYSTRPVLSEYVSGSSVLVGQQIDSITVNLKKSSPSATGSAQIGIINPDLSMKKVFATLDISTLSSTSYLPQEFNLASGDSYTIQTGDRIGVKNTGGTGSSNYVSIMRDINTSDPFDGANTYLSYYTSSWTAQTAYDLVMTLKWSGTGGGGTNTVPVSNAGPDQSVNEGTLVTLTGLGSTDSDGTVASYAWSQTSGPAVTLSSTTASQPTFTAPSVSAATPLVFSLVVTDNDGAADATPDSVTVTVNDVTSPNNPPVANAGPDQTVNENVLVTLTGLGSTDSDGTVASYAWSQTGGSPTVTLTGANTAQPTFTAPSVSATTDLTFSLVVTDNDGTADSTPDTMTVTVNDVPPGGQEPGIVMQDTTTGGTGWGIYSTRPVLSEYVGSSSALVGKQIDSITVNIKKSESSAVGTAQIGIINPDLSMKKVFANIDISTLTTSYAPKEFLLPSGDNYTIEAGDRIGIKYAGASSSANYISIMRDINTSDPYDGANTYLSYYTSSWNAQTTYDLVMTLKLLS